MADVHPLIALAGSGGMSSEAKVLKAKFFKPASGMPQGTELNPYALGR